MTSFYQTKKEEFCYTEYAHLLKSYNLSFVKNFRYILRFHTLFHLSFFFLFCIELALFFSTALISIKSILTAVSLTSLTLSVFSYLILHHYLDIQKALKFKQLKTNFLMNSQKISSPHITEEHILSLNVTNAIHIAHFLEKPSIYILSIPPFEFFKHYAITGQKILHHRAVMQMKEIILSIAFEKSFLLIQEHPIKPSSHISLIDTYLALAKTYQHALRLSNSLPLRKIRKKFTQQLQEKIIFAFEQTIEELHILDRLFPQEPWIHAKLASCHHILGAIDKELKEYEILSQLCPKNKEVLLHLGILYFKMGETASGLSTYQTLRNIDAKYGCILLHHYTKPNKISVG